EPLELTGSLEEMARAHVRHQLERGAFLSASLLHTNLSFGDFYTTLPVELIADLKNWAWGVRYPSNDSLDCVARMISNEMVATESSLCLLEDALSAPGDPWLE